MILKSYVSNTRDTEYIPQMCVYVYIYVYIYIYIAWVDEYTYQNRYCLLQSNPWKVQLTAHWECFCIRYLVLTAVDVDNS